MLIVCAQNLQEIQPDGPVTILGDTWGGPVAIELASLLQSNKRTVRTFLVEGSPFTWQQRIRTLGQINTSEFDLNLLATMINISVKVRFECTYIILVQEESNYIANSLS